MPATPKIFLFLAFFLITKNTKIFQIESQIETFSFHKHFTLISKTLSLRKWFLNKKHFRLEKNFTFVSKSLLLCKWFMNKTFSFQKKIIFVSETLSLFFRKHFIL